METITPTEGIMHTRGVAGIVIQWSLEIGNGKCYTIT